jgi:poly-gamma-glutamate capsule biosynthesis protein CapA/YwtB (metallophosphatase superfamily)
LDGERLGSKLFLKTASALGGGIALGPLAGALGVEAMQSEGSDLPAASTAPLLVAYCDPGLPDALGDSLAKVLDGVQPTLALTKASPFASTSDLYLGTAPPDGVAAQQVGRLDFVPVTHYRRWERSVTLDALRGIFSGGVGDWLKLGGRAERLELAIDRDSVPLVARALGVATPRVPASSGNPQRFPTASWADRVYIFETVEGVVEHVSTNLNALGILPATALSFEVRPLAVGGVRLLRSREPWPLGVSIWLGARGQAIPASVLAACQEQLGASIGKPPETITLTAVGDVMFGRRTDLAMVTRNDYTSPWLKVGAELSSADVTVCNLESPISDRIKVNHNFGTYTFGTSAKATKGLNFAGIDAVSLANNHTLNSGTQPLLDTFRALDAAGVKYFGAGANIVEARRPAIVEAKGIRFAFLGYDDITGNVYGAGESRPGNAPLNVANVVADIKAARERADVVIPFFHWGIEYQLYPNTRQRDVAKAAVDAGAGLVLGSHPHWVEAIEFYEGVLIAYSLGNFVFDQPWIETKQGFAIRSTWRGKKLVSFDLLPVHIYDWHQPLWLDPETGEGRQIVERVYEASMDNFRRRA